jgi:hypothetical protein
MLACVIRLRRMGVLQRLGPRPKRDWAHGIPEMSSSGFGGPAVPRCLVLRDARSNPDRGLLMELYQPSVVDIRDECLRLRDIEAMSLGQGQQAAMVQEWLVRFYGP